MTTPLDSGGRSALAHGRVGAQSRWVAIYTPTPADPPPEEAGGEGGRGTRAGDHDGPAAPGGGVDKSNGVRRPGELWRIEGSLYAVRAEIDSLEAVDDAALRARLAELERRWRDELASILPDSVATELHRYFDWLGEEPAQLSELRVGLAQLTGWLDGLISELGLPAAETDET